MDFHAPENLIFLALYEVAEIEEECVVGDATGFMFYRLWKSVCQKVQTAKTYQLSHMMLRQDQGELYLVSTLNTTAEEIQQHGRK